MTMLARQLSAVVLVTFVSSAAQAQTAVAVPDATPAWPNEWGLRVSQPPRQDSVLNGVLIGAAAGGLLGLIPDYLDDCEECHDSLYASIAVGAGVGLLIDLLRRDDRPTDSVIPGVPVQLAITVRSVGVRGAIRWR